MKAISLHQPWASLIAAGIKTIETRSWAPPKALIGQRIAIHAAKKKMPWPYNPQKHSDVPELQALASVGSPPIHHGVVVATAVMVSALQVSKVSDGFALYSPRTCRGPQPSYPYIRIDPYGDFTVGRWLWFLEDIEKLDPPVPATGHQGFWNWTPDTNE